MIFKVNPQSSDHTGGEIKEQLKLVSLVVMSCRWGDGITTSTNTALRDI